jgi:hypothetical protein
VPITPALPEPGLEQQDVAPADEELPEEALPEEAPKGEEKAPADSAPAEPRLESEAEPMPSRLGALLALTALGWSLGRPGELALSQAARAPGSDRRRPGYDPLLGGRRS